MQARPSLPAIAIVLSARKRQQPDVARFGPVNLDTIEDFGGWHEAQPKFFGDGGIFDQIYATP